jgi:thiol:disulfide interchange protein DsbD
VAAGEYPIKLNATWQACQDSGVCLQPVTVSIEATLKVAAAGSAAVPINAEIFAAAPTVDIQLNKARSLRIPFFGLDFDIDPTNLLILLPLAALGGFLLNFTPCVLPLVPIKVLGLVQAGGTRSRTLLLGIATFSGVIVFWLGLGVAISTISGFTATNQLFQFPAFTLTVGLLIAVMAVGMLGAFAVRLPQWVYFVNPKQESVPGSVTFGVMIAVLSTPCTAPAMGAAAAWAATQSPVITLATFAAIGTGMALPYLLLATFPKLVDRMPRTGPASELIKQVMGLLMMAAAAYFLGTGLSGLLVSPPDPPSRLYWWAVAGLVILAGLWLARRTLAITRRPGKRVVFVMIALLMIVGGLYIGLDFTRHGPVRWTYYTPDRLAAARSEGKVVVLEFTAEWCLNCKLLEQAVLHTDAVADLLNSTDVAPIKIDLTGNNEAGNAKLLEVGRRTIPLLVIYGRDGSELLKSDAYTPSQVIEALQQARGERLE